MNAGQIIMSMMQGVSTTVPDAAVTAGGEQTPGEGGFADLLVTLQTEAQHFQKVSETGSEPAQSEPEPVTVQSEGVAGLTQGSLEMSNAGAQMILVAYSQPARMPVVNDQPVPEVDMLQNVAETHQAAQPSVTLPAVAAKMGLKQFEEPVLAQSNAPEVTVSNPATSLQQNGRMPIVNNQASHDVDTVQNAQGIKAATADQKQLTVSEPPPVRSSATVEMSSETVAAPVQPQLTESLPQNGRMPIVNTSPSHEIDAAQKVPSAPVQTLEEISFSLTRPITVSKVVQLESNQMLQPAVASGSQIISLDMDQIQSSAAGSDSAGVLPEGSVSVRHQDIGKVSATPNVTDPNPLSTRKEQPVIVMPDTRSGSLPLPPEADTVVREAADIHPVAQQRTLHNQPVQPAADTRNEHDRPSNTPSVTKEVLFSQQGMASVSEAALTSDDSMGRGKQSETDQNPDSQMLTPLVHVQSKPEHSSVAALSSNKINPEQSGQELPERVAHQVRERLNQHDVKQGSQQITLTLSPENLGEVKMSLNLQGQRLSVEILTENRLVRDAILQHSDSLKESLARQNIAVESFDVTANGRGSGNAGHNQDAWKELARQKQQQHFWTSNGVYHPAPLESQTNPLAYRAKNEQTMLDIHY